MDSDTNLVLRPDSVLIMVDRQTQPSSGDIQKMQFMRVTNIHHSEIQANFDMSNLLISKTPLVSKWSSIPELFPYILLYFDLVCVELAYDENSAVSKWFFIPVRSFPSVLPLVVSKSKCVQKTYFGQHSNSSIIALINFQCVFIRDIAAVKHGAHGISANGGSFDIQLKPVIGKLMVLNNQSALIDR